MAVNQAASASVPGGTSRRVLVGTNVLLTTLASIAVVGVAQYLFYYLPATKVDMTNSGINSLSQSTANLLKGLEGNVRLTSMYFKTDIEDEDQQRYRRAVDDLLGLYASTNRSKVTADWINPLSDHDKVNALVTRVRNSPAFKTEVEAYKAKVDRYIERFDAAMRSTAQKELELISASGGVTTDPALQKAVAPVQELLSHWTRALEETRSDIDAMLARENPQYSEVVRELKALYRDFSKVLNDIAAHGRNVAGKSDGLSGAQFEFLRDAGNRYATLVSELEVENTALNDLKPLKVDDILRELTPNGNPILVETDQDARVVDFSSVWPPMNQEAAGRRLAFKDRAFKGEDKLTSAILRVTHKEQTAVVFVRFGGAPLFLGGFMPGQPPAPYAQIKQQLEEANFVVEEWDLKTKDTQPEIDPKPTRTIFVVLKPTTPERNPMMGQQQPQEPPISEVQKKALIDAIGENGRALFIAGWHPGPFPQAPIPATYEYNDYLKKTWGISVDTQPLLIEMTNTGPGKYNVTRRDWMMMREMQILENEILAGAQVGPIVFPWCAPLKVEATLPEGVELKRVIVQPKKDGVWGVKNLQTYEEQQQEQGFMAKAADDLEGPFDLALAAKKGNAKVVVVSARDFANDQIAFAQELGVTSQGFTLRLRNPGNLALLVNSMHWLNDNTQFMDIGRPIETAVLNIPGGSTVSVVKFVTIFLWPALALACGGVAWWVRRR